MSNLLCSNLEEALNRAEVEASYKLKRPENIYFPPTIRASDLPSTQGEVASTIADPIKEAQPQDPLPPNQQDTPYALHKLRKKA